MHSRLRAVGKTALAIVLPAIAAGALISTTQAQEPEPATCQLSDLVLLSASPGSGATPDTPEIADVAFPGEACLFLRASFASVFETGGGPAPPTPEAAEFAGGCALAEVVGDVVTETPALAGGIGTVPDVSLSQEACGALKFAYGLLAAGELTPLAAPATGSAVVPPAITTSDAAPEPIIEPSDEPAEPEATEEDAVTAEPLSVRLLEEGEAADADAPACDLSDLLSDFYGQAPELASEEPLPSGELSAEGCDALTLLFGRVVTLLNTEPAAEPVAGTTEAEEPAVEEESTTPDTGVTPEGEPVEAEGSPTP